MNHPIADPAYLAPRARRAARPEQLVLDGVFSEARPGRLPFTPRPHRATTTWRTSSPPSAPVSERLLARRHLEPADDTAPADPLAEVSPVLAGLVEASVQGRVVLGPRAGARVRRLGDEPDLGHVASRGPRQAQLDGFDLHANVWVPPNDRARLEQLCRYLLRPPLAQARLRLRADGRVLTASSPRVRAGARRSSTTAAQSST